MLRSLIDPLLGRAQARADHRKALALRPDIIKGIAAVQAQLPNHDDNDQEQPIFLLSAGWRSGSTLLQRLIMSDSNILIWGEPYDECGMIQALAGSMRAFRPGWPPQDYYYDGNTPPGQLSSEWIANLFPSLNDMRQAHRSFFDALFTEPAKRAGAKRWGIKEVRLHAGHAHYLRWLYPKARFVFLYRNPLDAYLSYCRYGCNWYDTFPGRPVFTPTRFGRHWQMLLQSFLNEAGKLDALLVRYEDVITGKFPLDKLEQHLDIAVDHSLLKIKVGSSENKKGASAMTRLDKWLLKRSVSPLAGKMGYEL